MKRAIDLILLWAGGLVIGCLAASFQSSPGYMDAEYYYAGARQFWRGDGLREPYLWNYISDPESLPAPAFTYWMPLASLLAWLGMTIRGSETFQAARLPFILLSSLVSPLTYIFSMRLSGQRFLALFAAIFAWMPMFYLAYLPTTDTFGVYMILGTMWLMLAGQISSLQRGQAFLAGVVSGLMHLARADGLFWMLVFWAMLVVSSGVRWRRRERLALSKIFVFLTGYMAIMGSWYWRNWIEFGTLFPPGNYRSLFLRDYNDLFRYPPSELSLSYLTQDGLLSLIYDRLYALYQNFQTFVAVQTQILLTPLFLLGYWKLRSNPILKAASVMWLVLFALMSFVFPFAGWRGGFFHVSAAFQPLVWSVSSVGFGVFLEWGVQHRNWNALQAAKVFSVFPLLFVLVLTAYLYHNRVIGTQLTQPIWDEDYRRQERICSHLKSVIPEIGLESTVVMINNPIGFYLACEKMAIPVPVGGERAIRSVAQNFGAKFMILESDHPSELSHYYDSPRNTSLLYLVDDEQEWKIYRVKECH